MLPSAAGSRRSPGTPSRNLPRPWPTFDRPPPGFAERAEIAHEVQVLFPSREVDLAVINHADPLFLKQVLERCRLLAGSPRRFAELKIYGFKRYQDHRRYLALESQHVRRVLGSA